MPQPGSWARGRAPGGRRSSGARPRAGEGSSALRLPDRLLEALLLGPLLRLGGALLGLREALLGRFGGLVRGAAGAVADRRLALGVDGGEQQPAEQTGVLQEVRDLPEALG